MRYFSLITRHWLVLLIVTVCTGAAAAGLSFIPQSYYQSEVQLLIVQKQNNTDAYTAQRAAEKIGKSLVNVIGTLHFLDRVIATGYISADIFSENSQDKKKQWGKLVEAKVLAETGIIQIFGYGINPGQAEDVALGVAQTLTTNAADYHGQGDTVGISVIDGPITSTRPVKPNIPLNTAAGAVLGFMVTFGYFILRLESESVQASKRQVHYEGIASAADSGAIFPLSPPEYKVLDEFPSEPFNYGATTETVKPDDTAVTMDDHMK